MRGFLLLAAAFAAAARADVRVVVAQDGSGDAKSVQEAIDHAAAYGSGRLIVEIRPGTYRERVVVGADKPRVTFRGKDAASTIITFNMSAAAGGGTSKSYTVDVRGAEFEAENVTFENSFGTGSQAVALAVRSDRAVFRKCRFIGWQDTLYADAGRQYYKDCYIEGHVDFIFGNATAAFDHCEIHSKGAGYLTAQSRLSAESTTGYVFYQCKLTGESTGRGVFLGRPWRPYSRVIYLECEMGDFIRPEGWDNWNHTEANEKTAWYAEYGSKGPGAKMSERVTWAKTITAEDAEKFKPATFLRGEDGWAAAK